MDVAEEGINIDVGVIESNVLLSFMASDISAISARACQAALQAA